MYKLNLLKYHHNIMKKKRGVSMKGECTVGHEGVIADISCMGIFSACFLHIFPMTPCSVKALPHSGMLYPICIAQHVLTYVVIVC